MHASMQGEKQLSEYLGTMNFPEAGQSTPEFTLSQVRRVLLKDGVWHSVYRPEQKDKNGLVTALENIRRKCDQLCKFKTDDEICKDPGLREYIPMRSRPERLGAKPFREIRLNGERWVIWPESQDPIPALMQITAKWSEITALEMEA
jgi:hypothetical protein